MPKSYSLDFRRKVVEAIKLDGLRKREASEIFNISRNTIDLNATFHKGGRIEELIEKAGCKVLYLPPYSPDFNNIEKCWS